MDFNKAIVTPEGQQMITEALAGDSMTFTRVVTSAAVGTVTPIAQETAIGSVEVKDAANVIIKAQLTNETLLQEYYIETVGVYAENSDGEILFATSSAKVAPHMPLFSEETPTSFFIRVSIGVGQSDIVNITVDPAGVATHQDLADLGTKKVDKVDGQGLSTNNYTTEAKNKVDAIPIDAKYTDTTYTAGSNVSIDATNQISATDTVYDDTQIKTDLSGKVDKVTDMGLSSNDYTDADKAKVTAIPANPKYTDTDTITTINGQTGAISKADITALGIPAQDTTYTAGENISIDNGVINNIVTDEGTDPDWVGVKYRLVMIDGELFAEVVSV